jgi:hypothetical protein
VPCSGRGGVLLKCVCVYTSDCESVGVLLKCVCVYTPCSGRFSVLPETVMSRKSGASKVLSGSKLRVVARVS